MTITVNIAEAKARFSQLLQAAITGEEVIIAKAGKPVAHLVPIHTPPPRKLGFFPLDIDDDFFDPLSGEELAAWE